MNKQLLISMISASMLLTGCFKGNEANNQTVSSTVDADAFLSDSLSQSIDDAGADADAAGSGLQKITASDCVGGVKNLVFENQSVFGSSIIVNGEVTRTYNNDDCLLSVAGDSFAREHDLVYTSMYRNAKLNSSSADDTNYLGEVIGGGEVLEKTASGYSLSIIGKNEELYSGGGRKLIDISIETVSPLQITGTLSRANRVVNSGSVATSHNLAKYTAVLSFEDVQWSANCRCPISGSISAEYSGNRSGSATINYQSCGKAELIASNGVTRQLTLNRCH